MNAVIRKVINNIAREYAITTIKYIVVADNKKDNIETNKALP